MTSSPVMLSRIMSALGKTASFLISSVMSSFSKHLEHVGAELDASADLAELGRLLDQLGAKRAWCEPNHDCEVLSLVASHPPP